MERGDRSPNVSKATCDAIEAANNREHKDMKADIAKLDNRIWWIVATGVLTVIMTGVSLWVQLQ